MEIVEIQPGVLQLPPGVPLEFDRPVRSITLVQTRNVSEAGSRPVANAVVEVAYADEPADEETEQAEPAPETDPNPAEAQSDAAGDRT